MNKVNELMALAITWVRRDAFEGQIKATQAEHALRTALCPVEIIGPHGIARAKSVDILRNAEAQRVLKDWNRIAEVHRGT